MKAARFLNQLLNEYDSVGMSFLATVRQAEEAGKLVGEVYEAIQELEHIEQRLEELELFKSEHLRLEAELNQILHPNGDGPTNPSFCDLVAYVRSDVKVMQRGGYLPERVSVNQVIGEVHHERVLPRAMWAQSEPLEVTPETVEKLKDELSKLRVLPRGLTPTITPIPNVGNLYILKGIIHITEVTPSLDFEVVEESLFYTGLEGDGEWVDTDMIPEGLQYGLKGMDWGFTPKLDDCYAVLHEFSFTDFQDYWGEWDSDVQTTRLIFKEVPFERAFPKPSEFNQEV